MTFKGDTIIGKPTLAMVEIYVAERGLLCEAIDAYNYWNKKEWFTKKGTEVISLENAIDVYYGIVFQKAMRKVARQRGIRNNSKKNKKKIKRESKKMLAGNKGLDNSIKLETFEPKNKIQPKKKKEWTPYDEQLKDGRWDAFRRFVFTVRGKKCEKCGSTSILQVHHPKYKRGHMAWEYSCREVIVVCRDCHQKIHKIQ